jgi:regulatory protein
MSEATELALRALRHREHSRLDLDRRLAKAGIPAPDREEALDGLAAAGLLSDMRFAQARARSLAERFAGDELIRRDLVHHGVRPEVVAEVLAELPAEAARAEQAFTRRGGGARALRYLVSKGFSAESLEHLDSLH